MITNERKIELFDEILAWAFEVIDDEEEIERFMKHMGFTTKEINTYKVNGEF